MGKETVLTHNVTTGSRRDRLVYFRLSEVEFREMLNACSAKGARSISDLARSALQEFIKPQTNEHQADLIELIGSLREAIHEMQSSIQELTATVRRAEAVTCQLRTMQPQATASPVNEQELKT
jgi:hypothetical protein